MKDLFIMKNISPLFKVAIALLLLIAVAVGYYLNNQLVQTEDNTYRQLADSLVSDLNNEERLIENIGITNAIYIAENNQIREALATNNRTNAITALNEIFENFKKSTRIKNLKVHIHTADVHSFVRSWKLDKFGDDLSGFRKTIVKVQETKQPVFDFEVGRMGLTLRSIVPIIENGIYLGSLEFIQEFTNVPKHFEKKGNQHLLLMNDSLIFIATDLKNAPSIDHYKLCSKSYNSQFFKAAQQLDLDALQEKGYILTDEYLYTYKTIKDMNENSVGLHLMGMSQSNVSTAVENAKQSTILMMIISAISIFIIVAVLFIFARARN